MVNIPRLRKRVEPNEKTVLETPLPRVAPVAPRCPQKSLEAVLKVIECSRQARCPLVDQGG
jgi:hypothetical protein